jgi:CsoR family transcriptional regulator, copper-sensing transcriptional repressor
MATGPSATQEAVGCARCDRQDADHETRRVEQPQKKALLNRVRRIEGQVGGVLNMIEQDRYCVDIITQISAIKSALDGVAVQILSTHANGCVRKAVLEDGGEEAIDELLGVVRRLMR